MDPLSILVAALITGASAAVQETATDAIRDAYNGFKALLRRKFGQREQSPDVVDEPPPETAEARAALERELRDVGAADDQELVAAAQRVLALVDPDGHRQGKYRVTVSGGQGVVIGDHAEVTMNFGEN